MKCPCHHCTDRHGLCWATCERYKEFKAAIDKSRVSEAKGRPARDFLADGARRAKAITHKKRRK